MAQREKRDLQRIDYLSLINGKTTSRKKDSEDVHSDDEIRSGDNENSTEDRVLLDATQSELNEVYDRSWSALRLKRKSYSCRRKYLR